jgi:hypothetical protein
VGRQTHSSLVMHATRPCTFDTGKRNDMFFLPCSHVVPMLGSHIDGHNGHGGAMARVDGVDRVGVERLPRAVVEQLRLVHLAQLDELSELRTRIRSSRQGMARPKNGKNMKKQSRADISRLPPNPTE